LDDLDSAGGFALLLHKGHWNKGWHQSDATRPEAFFRALSFGSLSPRFFLFPLYLYLYPSAALHGGVPSEAKSLPRRKR
jgi:hypothetical protein